MRFCGATETAGGVEAVQVMVVSVSQGFRDSCVEVNSLNRPCRLSREQGSLKRLVADFLGMDQHLHFGSTQGACSCWYESA